MPKPPRLILKSGESFVGTSFGKTISTSGEVVFATGMTGYPESLTDPSYAGQILVFTYPLIGNYGVPSSETWESGRIHVSGVVVSNYIPTPSHAASRMPLGAWLAREGIPGMEIKDTRALAKKIRAEGAILGTMLCGGGGVRFDDPNKRNLVAEVSPKRPVTHGGGKKTVVLIDCGAKASIIRHLVARGVRVIAVPWDYDIFARNLSFDAVVVSNGPGDPKMARATIACVRKTLACRVPILGICLGNQILALAAGGNTYKLAFGHRGQNQPCRMAGTPRSFLTTQNHGFAVGKVPRGFRPWFVNANDGTNEGLMHPKLPVMSVQFHPEANPGPEDTAWIFDHFLKRIR